MQRLLLEHRLHFTLGFVNGGIAQADLIGVGKCFDKITQVRVAGTVHAEGGELIAAFLLLQLDLGRDEFLGLFADLIAGAGVGATAATALLVGIAVVSLLVGIAVVLFGFLVQ